MKDQIVFEFIKAALGLAGTILTVVLIPKLTQYINSKIHNEKLNSVILDLSNSAAVVVSYLEQTMVTQLKEDGKWNSESQKAVLGKAVDLVIQRLAKKTITTLKNDSIDVIPLVTSYIEAQINSMHSKEG
jgi:uncharacterized membrane protein